jgi:hypothetical protein
VVPLSVKLRKQRALRSRQIDDQFGCEGSTRTIGAWVPMREDSDGKFRVRRPKPAGSTMSAGRVSSEVNET